MTASGLVLPTELPSGITFPHFIMATATTSQAHTPGPWYLSTKCPLASDDINRIEFCIFSEKGNIATIPTDLILHVNRDAESNARLIAQAPALLKSCKDLVDSIDMGDMFDHDFDCQDPDKCVLCVARKVIADAEG